MARAARNRRLTTARTEGLDEYTGLFHELLQCYSAL